MLKTRFWAFLRLAATPLLISGLLTCLYAASAIHVLPSPSAMLALLATRLVAHRFGFVFTCSLIENLVGVNAYFPGAFVILFAMASTHGDIPAAWTTFASIISGACIAQHVNFVIGRVISRVRLAPGGSIWRIIAAGIGAYWHPQLGSALSFDCGLSRAPYSRFAAMLITAWLPWNIFWGLLMYQLGRVPVNPGQFIYLFLVYLAGWILLALWRASR